MQRRTGTGGCVLWVGGEGASDAALVPLTFDPSSPIGPPPSATAVPATDLVDGQEVHVDADGYEVNVISVHQCPEDAHLTSQCDLAISSANVPVDIRVRTIVRAYGGQATDCRVEACVVDVHPTHGPSFRLPLQFDEAARLLPRRLTLSTNGNLRATQGLEVRGGRFPGDSNRNAIRLLQCVGPISREGIGHRCDPEATVRVAVGPTFEEHMVVHRRIWAPGEGIVDCRVRHCRVLLVESRNRDVWGTTRLLFRGR